MSSATKGIAKPQLRLLIVEDSPDDAVLLERYLRKAGYDLFTRRADTGAGVRDALAGGEWDAVVCDWTIPGFSAPEALRLVKATGRDLPFIIVSGTIGEETAVMAMRAGAHDYILKDNLARLVPVIEREIQEARARQARRQAEQELRALQERFQATFNQAAVGMAHLGLDGEWLMMNQRLCSMLGYSREELLGLRLHELTPDQDLEDEAPLHECLLAGSCESYSCEKRLRRGDGSYVPVTFTCSLVRDDAGAAKYFIAVIEDISERKRAEEERERLTQMVISNEKLAAAGRMAATLAHEINNPLEGLTNLLYLLSARATWDEQSRTLLGMAESELQRVSHITRSTLSFYREAPAPVRIRVTDLVEEALALYEPKLARQGVAIERRYEDAQDAPEVTGMPGELRQVISNLLANAMEAMPGGGRVVVKVAPTQFNGSRGTAVTVADSGTGIPPEHRQNLFQPFYTTKGQRGTGLGLWVSRGIVQKHGGSLRFRSASSPERHGTVFRLLLPQVSPQVDAAIA